MWSGVSVCGGLEASPTVCRQREALSISRSCSTGCQCSPYTFRGAKALYGYIGGTVVDLPWGDAAHSGSIQLGQGTAVPEVAGSMPVKASLVPVEAHQGKEFLEDLVL